MWHICSFSAGVTLERLSEGLSPRHCALSLVGEPIMYPEINSLIDELHRRRISTFLVTNAQFPDRIKALKPITQVKFCADVDLKMLPFVCQPVEDLTLDLIVTVICECGCCNKG